MQNLIIPDFDVLLKCVKESIEQSGSIKDWIQSNEYDRNKDFYVTTIEEKDNVLTYKFKLKAKPSRVFKISNQEELEKYLPIFYFRYMTFRQLVNLNLHRLVSAFVEKRIELNSVDAEHCLTEEAWLPSGDMVVGYKDAPYEYYILFNGNANMLTKVHGDTTMANTRNHHSLCEAVMHMVKFITNSAKTDEEIAKLEDVLNDTFITGHEFILDQEIYNVK